VVNLWPTDPRSRPLRLWFTVFFCPPDEALALLDNTDLRPADLEPAAVAAWRDFIKAHQSGDAAASAKAGKTVAGLADRQEFDRANAVQVLALLGNVDGAFDQIKKYIDEAGGYHRGMLILPPAILFYPTTAAMRRDPRFMPFAAKLGLAGYWRATGKWPDFCSEPDLPYDCRQAAKAAARPLIRHAGPRNERTGECQLLAHSGHWVERWSMAAPGPKRIFATTSEAGKSYSLAYFIAFSLRFVPSSQTLTEGSLSCVKPSLQLCFC
jgi:hypothetical protein